VGVILNWTD